MIRLNSLMIVLTFALNASAETPSEMLDRFEEMARKVKSWERTTKRTANAEGVQIVTTSVERATRVDGVLKTFTEEEEVMS